MNVACDYEAPMQMLTTEKYIAPCTVLIEVMLSTSLLELSTLFGGRCGRIWVEE